MPNYIVTFIRRERQLGFLEVEAPDIYTAERKAKRRVKTIRDGSEPLDSWEQDCKGHTVEVAAIVPRP